MNCVHILPVLIITGGLASSAWGEGVDSNTFSGVQVFLEVYQTLSQGRSAFFYELYSDNARIVAALPGRSPMFFPGASYKGWGKELISRGQAFPDGSRFEGLEVERRGSRLYVHARRYSVSRCYADPGYSAVLEPNGTGYRILEEHLVLNSAASCAPPDSMQQRSEGPPRASSPLPRAVWRPMSAEDMSATALRLAQQMPHAAVPQRPAGPAPTTEPVPRPPSRSDLWVSPAEPR